MVELCVRWSQPGAIYWWHSYARLPLAGPRRGWLSKRALLKQLLYQAIPMRKGMRESGARMPWLTRLSRIVQRQDGRRLVAQLVMDFQPAKYLSLARQPMNQHSHPRHGASEQLPNTCSSDSSLVNLTQFSCLLRHSLPSREWLLQIRRLRGK